MHEEGFRKLCGIDYSQYAVGLAKQVAESKGVEVECQTFDLLGDSAMPRKFQVVHDKGTFDAICLNKEANRKLYSKNVLRMMDLEYEDCYFVITSCNWTKEELLLNFSAGMM